jgi:hypothetical protein
MTSTYTNNPTNILNDHTSSLPIEEKSDNENKSNDDDDDEKDNTLDELADEEEMRVCK